MDGSRPMSRFRLVSWLKGCSRRIQASMRKNPVAMSRVVWFSSLMMVVRTDSSLWVSLSM